MDAQVEQTKMMSDRLIVLSDLHGSYLTMLALLARYPNHQPIFLGDLIDRGPRSREVVGYAMTNKIPTCLGNHCDLVLAYSAHAKLGYRAKCSSYYDRDVWLHNGGDKALESWGLHRGQPLPKTVLEWIVNLPPYIIPDVEQVNGRKLFLSHTGYGLDADQNNWLRALWGRYPDDGEFAYEKGTGKSIHDGWFRVFGHTRCKQAIVTPSYVNIDTGCAYKGYGVLSAFLWPEMMVVTQESVDD